VTIHYWPLTPPTKFCYLQGGSSWEIVGLSRWILSRERCFNQEWRIHTHCSSWTELQTPSYFSSWWEIWSHWALYFPHCCESHQSLQGSITGRIQQLTGCQTTLPHLQIWKGHSYYLQIIRNKKEVN
jgi:hypothetical protein